MGATPSSVAGAMPADLPWGLYVHLPFCPYKCHYCDFVAVAAGPRLLARWVPRYLTALRRELDLRRAAFAERPPVSVFFGGGTPTLLAAADLAGLLRDLDAPAGCEASIEANPETVDARTLATLRASGFDRLSLGLQAWQDELLARLGRQASRADFLRAFAAARAAGFDNVGVDLMYGLPGQSPAAWSETLDAVIALAPEHVSAYSLQIEPGTVFGAHPPRVPGEDAEARMYALARARLAAAGYEHYEISNWALPGRRCRHNLLYWRNEGWLGLGIGAASHVPGRRWTNAARLAPYCEAVEAGQSPPADEVACDEISDFMILGLRLLADGVNRYAFRTRHGVDLDAVYGRTVRNLTARRLLADDGRTIRLTRRGALLGNQVFAEFL